MSAMVETLRALAYRSAPANEANTEIERARDEVATESLPGQSYEVVLESEWDDARVRSELLGKLLPRFVYFLSSSRMGWPRCEGLVVSLFTGDRLHFLRGEVFARWLVAQSGESPEQLLARHKA